MAADNDRYPRWQIIVINQLGYSLNLVLTLSVAALAYWFQLLRDTDFSPGPTAKGWMLVAFVALGLGALSGIACVLTRLRDFRGTAQRARNNPEALPKSVLDAIGTELTS
jgi:hypothetical protein